MSLFKIPLQQRLSTRRSADSGEKKVQGVVISNYNSYMSHYHKLDFIFSLNLCRL
jgi:hypothetical protein